MKKHRDKGGKTPEDDQRPDYVVMIHNGTPTSGKVTVCLDKEHLQRVMRKAIEENGHSVPKHTIFAKKRFEVKIVEVDEV